MSDQPPPSLRASIPLTASGRLAWMATAIVVHLLLLSAAVETYRAGAPARWWVIAAIAVYFGAIGAVWRLRSAVTRRLRPTTLATAGAAVFLALFSATAWTAGGTSEGLRLLGLSTSTLLSIISLAAVALAGHTLVRDARLPVAARWTLLAISAYGIVAFLVAIGRGTPFVAQMQGESFWSRLPFWLQGTFFGAVVIVPLAILSEALRIYQQMRLRHPLRAIVHRTVAMTMAFMMVLAALTAPGGVPISLPSSAGPAAAVDSPPEPARLGAPERLAQILRVVEAAEQEIPRETFDPNAVVRVVGPDPARLFEWVRDNTFWVPYRGALRGPVGVLMDRLGNSLDRALLLAELLRTAGHTVRLVHGSLSDQRAAELHLRVRPIPSAPMPRQDRATGDPLKTDLGPISKALQLDAGTLRANLERLTIEAEQLASELTKRVGVQAPFLINAVTAAAPLDATSRTLAAMRDHWWVQRQDGAAWVDLDPLLPDAEPAGSLVQAEQSFAFDRPSGEIPLPGEYAHEISIRVLVEQWKAGQLTEKTALAHTFRPAEVLGRPIVIQNSPLGPPEPRRIMREADPRGSLKSLVLGQTEWIPELAIGDRTIRQSSFTAAGELKDRPGGRASQAQARGVGGRGGGFDALGGGAEPEAPEGGGYLTAEWIEYQIRVPGEPPRTVRRDVFDLLDQLPRNGQPIADPLPTTEQNAERALSLLTTIQVLPVVCRLSPQYVMEQTLTGIIGNATAVSAIAASVAGRDLDGLIEQAKRMKPSSDRLLSLALERFEWNRSSQDVYLDTPNILSSRVVMTTDAAGRLQVRYGFDIVANSVAVRAGVTASPFQVRLSQGIADTNAEALLVGPARAVNAGTLMSEGTPVRSGWVTLRRSDDPAWSNTPWPTGIRARMRQAVEAGYIVVAPRSTGAVATPEWAWWQIDPSTGSTLGIGQDGWGQAVVEKSLLDVLLPAQMAFQLVFAWAFLYCIANDSASSNEAWVITSDNLSKCACAGLAAGAAAGAFVAAPAYGVGLAMVAAAVYKEAVCA